MMKKILAALQFLTIFPIGTQTTDKKDLGPALIYFPVIGIFIGLILAATAVILQSLGFRELPLSIMVILALTAITGGLHLDGLADTTDGLYGRKEKNDILGIMRDPHIGTIGVLAIVSALLLKIAFFYSLTDGLKIPALFLMCLLSRWTMVMLIYLFPYAREEGKAKAFIDGVDLKIFGIATAITVISAGLIWRGKGLIAWIITAVIAFLIGKLIAKKIGGITGDVLGATNEIVEVICLFTMCVLGGTRLWLM
ncbi:MAG: adenosylcobinamide-GDP ribazoletransferase [Candidatus Omnitrophota bacterium]|jgi:adenosylcobinamide-GDP ribazoletransferase